MTSAKTIKSRNLPISLNIWLLNLSPCQGDLEAFRLCRTQIQQPPTDQAFKGAQTVYLAAPPSSAQLGYQAFRRHFPHIEARHLWLVDWLWDLPVQQVFDIYPFNRYIENTSFTGIRCWTRFAKDTPSMKQILSLSSQLTPLLQAARKSAGLSQTDLATRLSLSQSRMSAMELDPSSIRLDQLLTLCSMLHLELMIQAKGEPKQNSADSTMQEW